MIIESTDLSVAHLENIHPNLLSLKAVVYEAVDENSYYQVQDNLYSELAEGALFYNSHSGLEIPEFGYFDDSNSTLSEGVEVVSRAVISNGERRIYISQKYLQAYAKFLEGINEIDLKYQIRPRQSMLHEMHHLYQWETDLEQISHDLLILEQEGGEAWLQTFSEKEAIKVANDLEQKLNLVLLR